MTQYTPILNLPQVAPNQNQKEATINTAIAILEAAMNDALTLSVNGDATLSVDQFTKYFYFTFTGFGGPITVTVPGSPRWFAVQNTGGYNLVVGCAGAGAANTTVQIGPGKVGLLISDGSNVRPVVPAPGVGQLGDLSNVSVSNPTDGEFLRFNATDNEWEAKDLSDLLYFYKLQDVPNYRSGQINGMLLGVAEDGSGIVAVPSAANIHKFTDLSDAPSSYTGSANLTLRVNPQASGLVFVQPKLTDNADFQAYTPADAGKYLQVGTVNGAQGVVLSQPKVKDLSDGPGQPSSALALQYVRVKSDGSGWEYANGTGGPDHFYQLADVPNSYTGKAGQVVRVNAGESGLEYWNFALSFTGLSDAPQSYTGYAGKFLRVNAQANGVAFQSAATADLSDGPGAPAAANALYVVRVASTGKTLEYHQLNFTDLAGVPSSFANQGGKFVAVKADGSGLQFVSSSVTTSFEALTDTPKSYTGQGGKILMVDGTAGGDGTGIVFATPKAIPTTLETLTDVTISNPTNGQVLTYNNGGWVAGAGGGGGSGNSSAVTLTSVGSHTYWRLLFLDTTGSGGYVGFHSLDMAVNSTGANLCTGGTLSASSAQPGSPAAAVLSSGTGDWRSTVGDEDGAFLAYQFPQPVQIGYVAIGASASAPGQAPRGFVLQYSDDGQAWTTVYKVRGQPGWAASEQRGFVTPSFIDTFVSLVDAPDSYAGSAGDYVRVKSDLTGVEFVPPPFIPLALSQLSDVSDVNPAPNYADILAFGQDGAWHATPAPNLLARDYGAHGHWRLRFTPQIDTQPDPTQPLGIAEFAFFAAFDTFTNLATGGAIVDSSEFSSTYVGANALDANPATSWRSTVAEAQSATGSWIGYSFAEPVKVGAFSITVNNTDGDWACRPGTAYVEYSDDGLQWLTAWQTTTEFPTGRNTPGAPATLRLFSPAQVNHFTDLEDVPHAYGYEAIGQVLRVRSDAQGLEFHPLSVLADLDDVENPTGGVQSGDVLTFKNGVWQAESPILPQAVNAGGAHLYWRIAVRSVYQGTTTSLAEVEFRASDAGPSIAISGSPVCSNPGDNNSANAFDGSTATVWTAAMGASGAYIGYKFSTPSSITQVALTANPNASVADTDSPASFDVQLSDDGQTWITLKSFSVASVSQWTQGTALTFELPHGYDFTDLLDVPNTYAGQGGAFVKVNAGGTGLEFDDVYVPARLGDLLDVEGPSSPPQEGEVLAYLDGVWQPKFVDALTPEATIYVTEPGGYAPPDPGAFTTVVDPDGVGPSFTLVQGVGTILNAKAAAGNKGWRQFLKATPSETSWSAYARLRPSFRNQPSIHFGLVVADLTGGGFVSFGMTGGSGGWQLNTWQNATKFNSTLLSENWGWGTDMWVRVDYANNLMTFSLSTNGQVWDEVATSNYIVPNHIGFGLHAEADSYTDVGQVSGSVLYYADTDYQPQALDFFNKITQYVVEPGGFGPPGQHDLVLLDPNATGASYLATISGTIITAPSVTTTTPALVGAYKLAPSKTPWSARARLRVSLASGEGRSVGGVTLFNQNTGRYLVFGPSMVNGVARAEVSHWSSVSSFFNVSYRGEALTPGAEWFQIETDGVTLSFYTSTNAISWTLVFQEPVSTFITGADKVGLALTPQTTSTANTSTNSLAIIYYADDSFTPQVPDPTSLMSAELEPTVAELADVSILTTPADGQVLVWNASKQRWIAGTPPPAALPVTAQNDNYTLGLSDANSCIQLGASTVRVVVVPLNVNTPFTEGTQITLVQTLAGAISIGASTGVTLLYPSDMRLQTRRQYSMVTLLKIGIDTWVVAGDLASASS